MGKNTLRQAWEARLAAEGLPAWIGDEAERHGGQRYRVLSLDVYPNLDEKSGVWAVWDCYACEGDDADADETSRARLPDAIRTIAEKRAAGVALSNAERKALERYRDGSYTGQIGRPRK